MHSLFASLCATLLYVLAFAYQSLQLTRGRRPNHRLLGLLVLLALVFHGQALFLQLRSTEGLDLEFFKAASLIAHAVILLTLLATLRMPVENLLLLLLPMGLATALLAQFVPQGTVEPIQEAPGLLVHILLSILAYGLLTIAAFQALLLAFQDHRLRSRQPSGWIRSFPPLQTMESLLFGFLWVGWGLLSLSLISGWLFLDNLFTQHLADKTLLSCFAWLVFGVLLWGRARLGWRGRQAIRWTLAGFVLLMLAYFGSKLVREYLLHI